MRRRILSETYSRKLNFDIGTTNFSTIIIKLIITIIIIHRCHYVYHLKNVSVWYPPSAARFYSCCSSLMGRVCTGWDYSLYLYINLLSPSSYPNLPQHLPIWRRFRSASWKGMFFVSPLRKVNALLRYSPLPPFLYLQTSYISRNWFLLFHFSPVCHGPCATLRCTYFSTISPHDYKYCSDYLQNIITKYNCQSKHNKNYCIMFHNMFYNYTFRPFSLGHLQVVYTRPWE